MHYTKIEQLASGAAYCQLFDALHPGTLSFPPRLSTNFFLPISGKVALHKVNFHAQHEYEFVRTLTLYFMLIISSQVKNYKVLQEAFQNVGLTKVIDVNNLVKATFMDNNQFFRVSIFLIRQTEIWF